MSLHSYSRVWVPLVWATLERRPLLDKAAAGEAIDPPHALRPRERHLRLFVERYELKWRDDKTVEARIFR